MAIKIFILSIIVISVILTNIKIDHKQQNDQYTHMPLLTFENLKMYDINSKHIQKIVQARQALNYKTMDELYDATIIIRNKHNQSDSISAEYIVKTGNIYKLYQGVNIIQSQQAQLTTDFLVYDELKRLSQNNTDFVLNYKNNELIGKNIYFDANNDIIKANNAHFKIRDIK